MSEKARILIAQSLARSGNVIATDSAWVAMEVDAISSYTDDLGILTPEENKSDPGIYLWEGTLEASFSQTFEGGCEPDGTEYTGTLRPIRPEELAELLAMSPPEIATNVAE